MQWLEQARLAVTYWSRIIIVNAPERICDIPMNWDNGEMDIVGDSHSATFSLIAPKCLILRQTAGCVHSRLRSCPS